MATRLPVRQSIVLAFVVFGLLLSGCSEASPQRTDSTLPIGVITAIAPGGFPCAASKDSLPELVKREKVASDVDAPDDSFNNLADALMRTKSIMLHSKDLVKVLDKGQGILKVSVVEHHSVFAFPYMVAAARGCCLADEALLH
jgi:hypothetical protein